VNLFRRNSGPDAAEHLGPQAAQFADHVRHFVGDRFDRIHDCESATGSNSVTATCFTPWVPTLSSCGLDAPPSKLEASAPDIMSAFTYDDVQAIQSECYLVKHATAELSSSLPVRSRFNSGVFSTHGITPVYQQIRSMNLAGGRHLSDADSPNQERFASSATMSKSSSLRSGRRLAPKSIFAMSLSR
jgi:hypothetical protein